MAIRRSTDPRPEKSTARELGGGRGAQLLTAAATALSTHVLIVTHMGSTATADLLVWTVVVLPVLRLLRSADERWWLAVGAAVGVGMLNRWLVVLLVAAIGGGLLVAGPRRVLRSGWPDHEPPRPMGRGAAPTDRAHGCGGTGQLGNLDEELDVVAATPAAVVRAELDEVHHNRPLPAVLRPLYDDPAAHLPTVVAQLRRYWQIAIEPVWPRLRALCAADLSYRMEKFAAGGLVSVLEDLHPDISFRDELLLVDKPFYCQHRIDLTGTGILLIPCVFSWPTPAVQCCGVEVPALGYPPRGVAELWRQARDDQPDPLCALLGRTRAALLAKLALPSTTTQLAGQLDMSPAAVSQQLKILKDTALVSGRRRGRLVLYQRTPAAAALLAAIQPDEAPPDGGPTAR